MSEFPRDFTDPQGRNYILNEEAWRLHIVAGHGEMHDRIDAIGEAIEKPEEIVESERSDNVYLYYNVADEDFFNDYICVVADSQDGVVKTAYGTNSKKSD